MKQKVSTMQGQKYQEDFPPNKNMSNAIHIGRPIHNIIITSLSFDNDLIYIATPITQPIHIPAEINNISIIEAGM